MGNGGTKQAKAYKIRKRKQRRVQKGGRIRQRNVVFVCREVLKEIWIHANEQKLTGIITFVTESGKEIRRTLVYTWFPQGIWKLKFDKELSRSREGVAEVVGAENVDKVIENRLTGLSKGGQIFLYQYVVRGKGDSDAAIDCLHQSVPGKTIPVRVTYAASGDGKAGDKITTRPLSDDYLSLLANELVARVYLIMLEHFAGINVKEEIARGGISRGEYRRIVAIKSKDPDLDPKKIARVVTQSTYEFVQAGYDEKASEYLVLMTETLLYQRKRKNVLAVANQLQIAKGLLRNPTGNFTQDLGIKRRGESALLLYDKFGSAVPAWVGFMDLHYRNIDLDKVKTISIKIGDPGFSEFLKVLEQTFSFPTRETYVFLASVSDFYKFIVEEVHRVYGGEIEKRVAEMLPVAIGFFVIHAVVGAMARRGNPYAAALIVVAKAVGWIMDIDMGIATAAKMAEAGRHFGQMEMIHRRSPKEKGKQQLTLLSKYHLEMGTRAMIAAMAEVIAMGVFMAGGKAGQRVAGRVAKHGGAAYNKLSKYLKTRRQDARVEITLQGDAIAKIRATKGTKTVEVQCNPTSARSSGTTRTSPGGQKGKRLDSPPLEEAGQNLGRRQRAEPPRQGRVVKPMEYDGYRQVDGQGRPASAEEVAGMPKDHMDAAIRTAKDLEYIVIFRTTNAKGVQHILTGHPPKGKDLIAL
ncbi:MAG: hypothetical protein R3178_01755, partial [Rhodothermales bacterium]|nr:hypothetical protein [Rhodothermales bacterium]